MLQTKIDKFLFYLRISLVWFLVCFYFKDLILKFFPAGGSYTGIISNLYFLKNTGAAFSMFKDFNFPLAFASGAVVLCITVCAAVYAEKFNRLELTALGLLNAGIASNMLERFVDGYVTDYFQLSFINFPVFNFADVCINAGAIILVYSLLKNTKGHA